MCVNDIQIIVSKGRFDSVEKASCSEKSVKWFVPDPNADAVTECYAAVELRNSIRKLFGNSAQRVPVIKFISPQEKRMKADLRIILGTPGSNTFIKELESHGELRKLKNCEGYLILGSEDRKGKTMIIAAKERKGVLNGVFRYLEELGMYWTSPDQEQAVWPEKIVLCQKNMRIEESPCFEIRGYCGGNGGDNPEKPLTWMARNRMNFGGPTKDYPEFAKKLGFLLVGGGHVFEKIFEPERKIKGGVKLFDAHPDWFAFRNGKRVRSPGHACMSNPDAVKYLIDNAIGLILKDAKLLDIYRFWPPDVWCSWCECKECRKKGNDADRYLSLVHKLRKKLDAEYKKGKIDHRIILYFIVYEGSGIYPPPTRPLPKGFDLKMNQMEVWPINRCYAHRHADPECREFNRHYWNDMKGWFKAFKGKKIMGEYYNVSQYWDMATVFSMVMFEDVRDYAAAGFTGLQYMHAAPGHWGPRSLTNWQLGRLQWNPGRDYDSMLHKFFFVRFGPVAKKAESLYRMLDKAMSNLSTIKSWMAGSVSRRLRHIYADTMADRSTEELFVYDHLRLHRPKHSNGEIGYGFDNFDDIMEALRVVKAGLVRLRRTARLPEVVRKNLDEDIWQVDYTIDFIGLHYEFALYWEANRYGKGNPNVHKERILKITEKLSSIEVPEPASSPEEDSANALERTALIGPIKKALGYQWEIKSKGRS